MCEHREHLGSPLILLQTLAPGFGFVGDKVFCNTSMRQKEKIYANYRHSTRKDTEKIRIWNTSSGLRPATDFPVSVSLFILQADTFTDKFVDGALICAVRVKGKTDKQASGGFICLLQHLRFSSVHNRRKRSGMRCRITKLWMFYCKGLRELLTWTCENTPVSILFWMSCIFAQNQTLTSLLEFEIKLFRCEQSLAVRHVFLTHRWGYS